MTQPDGHNRFPDTLRELRPWLRGDADGMSWTIARLEELAAALAGYDPSSDQAERAARRARVKVFRETRQASRRLLDVLETARPREVRELRRLLAPTLGELFSNTAFAALDAGIPSGIGERDIDRWHARYRRSPDEIAQEIEGNAVGTRQEIARQVGDRLLRRMLTRIIRDLDRRLEQELLSAPNGRPVDSPRLLAFARLWDIYRTLTATERLPLSPPQAYLTLCNVAFGELDLPEKGLEDAAERAFRRAHQRMTRGA